VKDIIQAIVTGARRATDADATTLVLAARGGDARAERDFYNICLPGMLSVTLPQYGRSLAADELVEVLGDTVIYALKNWNPALGSLTGHVQSVARNRMLNLFRNRAAAKRGGMHPHLPLDMSECELGMPVAKQTDVSLSIPDDAREQGFAALRQAIAEQPPYARPELNARLDAVLRDEDGEYDPSSPGGKRWGLTVRRAHEIFSAIPE